MLQFACARVYSRGTLGQEEVTIGVAAKKKSKKGGKKK